MGVAPLPPCFKKRKVAFMTAAFETFGVASQRDESVENSDFSIAGGM